MRKYKAILEEWEEVDDPKASEAHNGLLNPDDSIDSEEKKAIAMCIRSTFEGQFDKAISYLHTFGPYL